MKNKVLEKLLDETKMKTTQYPKEVSINIEYKKYYIISVVDIEKDVCEIETNVNLTELQEDMITNQLKQEWHFQFDDWDKHAVTMDDRINAMEVIFKTVR